MKNVAFQAGTEQRENDGGHQPAGERAGGQTGEPPGTGGRRRARIGRRGALPSFFSFLFLFFWFGLVWFGFLWRCGSVVDWLFHRCVSVLFAFLVHSKRSRTSRSTRSTGPTSTSPAIFRDEAATEPVCLVPTRPNSSQLVPTRPNSLVLPPYSFFLPVVNPLNVPLMSSWFRFFFLMKLLRYTESCRVSLSFTEFS